MSEWYLRTPEGTFGPETEAKLVEWAKLGKIMPGQEISEDEITWLHVEDVPFLDMRFSIDIGDGRPRGPFNKVAAETLLSSGRLPLTATMIESREPFTVEDNELAPAVEEASVEEEKVEEPVIVPEPEIEDVGEKEIVVKEVIKEVRVEVPVEKIVEKEVIKEVPVEKVVEVEKIVVDETRVKELEGLLEVERRHATELQERFDQASKSAAEAAKVAAEKENGLRLEIRAEKERADKLEASLNDAVSREDKQREQIEHLEDELRRLPQAASEVADIQAAMYSIMKSEIEEVAQLIEQEKKDFEEAKKRYTERADRLLERRREMLKRSGANIEDMTRKALIERPEDPRTSLLRKELDELRRNSDRERLAYEDKLRSLEEQLRQSKATGMRAAAGEKDITQLRLELQDTKERLQARENELVVERQRNEAMSQQQAARQQTLLARLAALESPSIGTAGTMATNQSREAKLVKLPSWMHLKR